MLEFTYELITVAATNPHFIFLFCNLIIIILILVSLEPNSNSVYEHTPTPIPPPQPPLHANENKSFIIATQTKSSQECINYVLIDSKKRQPQECTTNVLIDTPTKPLQEHTTNVFIDVEQVLYDCNLLVREDNEELHDDELKRKVEEFIDKIYNGWKAEKLSLVNGSLSNQDGRGHSTVDESHLSTQLEDHVNVIQIAPNLIPEEQEMVFVTPLFVKKTLGMEICHALADLGASINLMPLSIWKKLSLLELTPTHMTLELADRSITHPKGVAEDVFVKVGKFHFLTDFIVVDFEADLRVPLILGRVNDESITFNLNQTMRYSLTYDETSVNRVDVIDVTCEDFVLDVLDFQYNPKSSNPTLVSDDLISDNDSSDSCSLPPMDLKLAEESKEKSFVEEPPELELKDLPSHLEYAFLEESNKLPVIIAKKLKVDEREALLNVLKSHKRVIAWKISNIKGIDPREGIALGHKISKSGIEVDRAKVDVIAKLPHPTTVKGVRSFLGHAGFYHRFIQDFLKIARPMTRLFKKETPFIFFMECIDAFNTLKKKITEAPILVVPD
nr:reverse transcriptase domain-containing protein [Tanacetum cinerariifolium]